jgi:hypothetical protein
MAQLLLGDDLVNLEEKRKPSDGASLCCKSRLRMKETGIFAMYSFVIGCALAFRMLEIKKLFEPPADFVFVECARALNMTFVSVPNSVKSVYECLKLKLAIASWLSSDPMSSVILFMNREDFCEQFGFADDLSRAFGDGRIRYVGPCCSDEGRIPFVNMWFIQGLSLCRTELVSFINSDIVLSAEWLPSVVWLLRSLRSDWRPVVFSARTDLWFPLDAFA